MGDEASVVRYTSSGSLSTSRSPYLSKFSKVSDDTYLFDVTFPDREWCPHLNILIPGQDDSALL